MQLKRPLVALPLATVGAVWFFFLILPWPILLRWHDPGSTSLIRQRRAEYGDSLEVRQSWVPLSRISPRLQRAVIVAEDARFREHAGIDWQALAQEFHYRGDDDFSLLDPSDLRALAGSFSYYRRHPDRVRGRSTITQQLAKNLYFSTERSVLRKVEEAIVAKRLEWFLSKDRILEIYLNVVELGPGVFGVQAAAEHYYGRSAADLDATQAAALAATLPHPLTSNPDLRPGRLHWRMDLILARMGAKGPVETVPLEEDTLPAPEIEPSDVLGEPVAPAVSAPDTGDTISDTSAVTSSDTSSVAGSDTTSGPRPIRIPAPQLPDTAAPDTTAARR